LARHGNFCLTNFNKIRKFLRNQDEFVTNCAVNKHTKISMEIRLSADIQKVNYRSVSTLHSAFKIEHRTK